MQISVIIVDNCSIIREGLKLLLEKQDHVKVTAEVNSIGELPDVLKNNTPDIIFINLVNKPLEILEEISPFIRNRPGFSFVLLTGKMVNHSILDCIEHGVHGMLNVDSKTDELYSAVLSVAAGESYVHLPLSRIKSKIIQHVHNEHAEHLDSTELTERENEVLKLFAEGLTYKEIGNKLFISPRTVETHKNNILTKLELKSVTDMVKFAIKHDLINL